MKRIIIAFGTQTGNTEIMAHELSIYINQWATTQVTPFSELTQEMIVWSDIIICGTSSWGDGTPNSETQLFIERLSTFTWDTHKPIHLFCMGDRAYGVEYFCGALHDLEQAFLQVGIQVMTPSLCIDGYPEGENLLYAYEWSAALAQAPRE